MTSRYDFVANEACALKHIFKQFFLKIRIYGIFGGGILNLKAREFSLLTASRLQKSGKKLARLE